MSRAETDLQNVRREMVRLSSLTIDMLMDCVRALEGMDDQLTRNVIRGDDEIDALRFLLDDLLTRILAVTHPMGDDLRGVVAAMRISHDLERIGDNTVNIANGLLKLRDAREVPLLPQLCEMGSICIDMLSDIMDAYLSHNLDVAYEACKRDDELDTLYQEIEMRATILREPAIAIQCVLMARYFERIGDHATNVCEWTVFECTGVLEELN